MKPIEFWKMNGSGNDFILIDDRQGRIEETEKQHLVERICRRKESVGADGVIFVVESSRYDFRWQYFNADGGEVEMCGNGGRCVSRFASLTGLAGNTMTFETLAGPISSEVKGRFVKVLMPKPTDLALDIGLASEPGWESVDSINTGVPHVVVRVDDLADHPVYEQGKAIRYHERFAPGGTNANFMKVIGPDLLEVRTYERGVEDETLACGTGAIACSLAASLRGLVDSPVYVRTRGGEDLTVYFRRKDVAFEEVWLEGNTTIVYQGQLNEEAL